MGFGPKMGRHFCGMPGLTLLFFPEEALEFDPLNREKPWMVIGTKCDMLHRDPLSPGCISLHMKLFVVVHMAVENINLG